MSPTTRKPTSASSRRPAADPPRRTAASLENELYVVRNELARVDRHNTQLRGDVSYAQYLLVLAALVLIAYFFFLSSRKH